MAVKQLGNKSRGFNFFIKVVTVTFTFDHLTKKILKSFVLSKIKAKEKSKAYRPMPSLVILVENTV